MVAEPDKLRLAREQLARVQVAVQDPEDWSDIALYGFYALENAVTTAADHFGVVWSKTHPSKVEAARRLRDLHGLPDVSRLLTELNDLRKSEAYGEILPSPSLTGEQIAIAIEAFVDSTVLAIGAE